MKIEVLFPEICNLYGDMGNIKYLKACVPDSKIILTGIQDVPSFINKDVDIVYIGGMPEKMQPTVIGKLQKYSEDIKNYVGDNKAFLATSNALELFGDYIEDEKFEKTQALGLINFHAKRNMAKRHNSIYVGKYDDIKIVGYKSQFSMSYSHDDSKFFSETVKGIGINEGSKYEGFKLNNFIATYLIGPILVLNPLLTQKLLEKVDSHVSLAFGEEVFAAYEKRLKEFSE